MLFKSSPKFSSGLWLIRICEAKSNNICKYPNQQSIYIFTIIFHSWIIWLCMCYNCLRKQFGVLHRPLADWSTDAIHGLLHPQTRTTAYVWVTHVRNDREWRAVDTCGSGHLHYSCYRGVPSVQRNPSYRVRRVSLLVAARSSWIRDLMTPPPVDRLCLSWTTDRI